MMRFQQQRQQQRRQSSISFLLLAYLLVLCCLSDSNNNNNNDCSFFLFTIGAPMNDDVCDATVLPITPTYNDNGLSSSSSSITIFNLTDATTETNETTNIFSNNNANSLTNTNSVWYKFHTGPSDRCITIFTEGLEGTDDNSTTTTTSIDPHMALYEVVVDDDVDEDESGDDCTNFNNFVLIAEDDDDGRRQNSLIRAVIKPSTTYYLQIDPYYENDPISGIVTAYTCLNNDDACNASQFSLLSSHDDGTTNTSSPPAVIVEQRYYYDLYWGTVEIGEINPGSGSTTSTTTSDGSENNNNNGCTANDGWCSFETDVDNSLWYKVVGPDSGCISITTTGGDTQVAIWLVDNVDDVQSEGSQGSGDGNQGSGDGSQGSGGGVECGNFTAFVELVAANDDHSETCNVGGLEDTACAAILSNVTVLPGKQYYIQLDGHNGLDAFGTITVTDCSSSSSSSTLGPTSGPTPGPTTPPTPGPTPGPTTPPTLGPTPGPTTSPTQGPTPGPACDCSGWPLGPKRRPATLDPSMGCAGYVDCEKIIQEGDIYHYKPCPNDFRFDVKNQICMWPWAFTCEDDITCVAAVQQQQQQQP